MVHKATRLGAGMRLSVNRQRFVGDEVKLRALWWEGPMPEHGDRLRTSTGRQYLIERIGKRRPPGVSFTLTCRVLPDGYAHSAGVVFAWTWTRKALRRPKGWRR